MSEQVEGLEHEADPVGAQRGALVVGQRADVDALEAVDAGGRAVEAAEHVHERRLARARGSRRSASESPGSSRRSTSVEGDHGRIAAERAPDAGELDDAGSACTSRSRRDRGAAAERAASASRAACAARAARAVRAPSGARSGAGSRRLAPAADDHEVAAAQPLAAGRPDLHIALGRQARHDADELGAAAGADLDARAAVAADGDRAHRNGENGAARAGHGDREPDGGADEATRTCRRG